MKDHGFWKKLGDFVLGRGFYIVLFLCVATIGISGYYLLQTVVSDAGAPAGGDASVTLPDQSAPAPQDWEQPSPGGTSAAAPDPVQTGTAPEAESRQPDDPQPPARVEEEQTTLSQVFTWPVKGAVLRDFSVETLSLDPTLGDWRTHGGLDIAAAQGVQVLAISRGTVTQVYEDGLMGTTVVVDHGGGLQSWYSGLEPETVVAEGDAVDVGTVIGAVGSTAIAEVGMESHLHLETTLNGALVDPREYLEG